MKWFFTMELKGYNEHCPISLAKNLIVEESPFVKYLHDNNALKIRHSKSKALMECYAKAKHLTIARIKYGRVLPGKMSFIEIFIQHQLKRKMELSKGST